MKPNNRYGKPRKYDYERIVNMKESGYSYGVIAGMVGAPEGTIASIVHRWRKGKIVI
jgi:DNA-directed RNA polymerase specialized sigma24 family protein